MSSNQRNYEWSRFRRGIRAFKVFAGRMVGSGAVVLLLVGGGACASGHVLTQGEIGRRGARSFAAPPETIFYGCVGVLKADGYEIATTDLAQGVIVTKPMPISSGGAVTARAYRVTISPDGTGSRVIASPALFAGERDVSDDEVWNLDGPRGEHALWSELFADLDAVAVQPATSVPNDEALAKARVMAAPPNTKTVAPESGLTRATLPLSPTAPRSRPSTAAPARAE
jgi:hypothetical protein